MQAPPREKNHNEFIDKMMQFIFLCTSGQVESLSLIWLPPVLLTIIPYWLCVSMLYLKIALQILSSNMHIHLFFSLLSTPNASFQTSAVPLFEFTIYLMS